ncbi:MAG: hypothetical protein WBV11_15945 [Salegentibacter sp.]
MKKLLLLSVLAFLGFNSAYSQGGFRIGVNAGIPVGDISDYSNLQLGADVAYRIGFADMLEVGPLVGYSVFFGDNNASDVQFLPVAASGRLGLTAFFVGADIGYAVGLDTGNDGGFYYKPQLGYNLGPVSLILSYSGVSMNGGNISSVNLGLEIGM